MRKYLIKLLILTAIIISNNINAQCPYDNVIYLAGPAPATVGATTTGPQTWAGEFNRLTGMQAGYTYEISTCNTPTFDSELTIYPAGGGSALAHDDDGCGTTGGSSKIIFTPTVSGDYDILLDEYGCYDDTIDMDMDITLISTGGNTGGVLNIPVVVHVVYKNASENISDAQIQSQIDALNRDYRKLNNDFANTPSVFQPLGADMNINFCLTSADPNGNPTNGITRTQTTIQAFSHNPDPKSTANGGHDNWDPIHYLNLWVCHLGGGLLGFASFPTDLATVPNLDGVVIDYAAFGTINATAPYDLGRTATHEVGHWLNLHHIWGDAQCGDDFVNDTPTQQQSNGGCPAFPHITCSNGPNGDLFNDYMDYTDDACMMLFTQGQKQRTDATIATIRTGLANSNGCGGTTGINTLNNNNSSFDVYPNPAHDHITISFNGKAGLLTRLKFFNIIGAAIKDIELVNKDGKNTLEVNNLSDGVYIVELTNGGARSFKKLVIK